MAARDDALMDLDKRLSGSMAPIARDSKIAARELASDQTK